MNKKELSNKLAKVNSNRAKIDMLLKENNSILITLTSTFKKGESVTYLDKNNTPVKGKVLYNTGQKSLTVRTEGKLKVNVTLDKLVLT